VGPSYVVQVKTRHLIWTPVFVAISMTAPKGVALWEALGYSRYYRYVRVMKIDGKKKKIVAAWTDGRRIDAC